MSASQRQKGDGLRTAHAVLGLLVEHSAGDFAAAEKVLEANKELARLVRFLRELKEREEAASRPPTVDKLREVVRTELLALGQDPQILADVIFEQLAFRPRVPTSARPEDVIRQALEHITQESAMPSEEVAPLVHLLLRAAFVEGGKERIERSLATLHNLAVQALVANVVTVPSVHSMAQLRTKWAPKPLGYSPEDSRESVAERLLWEVKELSPADWQRYTIELLETGLRLPAEGAVARVRRLNAKKKTAHGDED